MESFVVLRYFWELITHLWTAKAQFG